MGGQGGEVREKVFRVDEWKAKICDGTVEHPWLENRIFVWVVVARIYNVESSCFGLLMA